MANQYKYGRRKERLAAQLLRGRGARVKLSKGSKGASDLEAVFPSGTKWKVQVKSTRAGAARRPSLKDQGRLKISATKSGATGVLARIVRNKVNFESIRDGRKLTPPTRRKR